MNIHKYIPDKIGSLSIIGTSKNAGKTTLLNTLLDEYGELGKKVGIVSVGLDGERHDVWSGKAKPAITVSPGTLLATSRLAIEESEARFEILEQIKGSSIGHEVYVLRTIKGGRVKLTGTPSLSEVEKVLGSFRTYGVEMSLVDGAYDRIASASPVLTDGLFLVIGASYHRSQAVVVEKVGQLIYQFTLPAFPFLEKREPLSLLFERKQAGWASTPSEVPIGIPYPFSQGWNHNLQGEEPYLFLPGSCTPSLLKTILTFEPIPMIVLQDSTRLFCKREELSSYYRKGGMIYVLNPIQLLGIAVNPTSPDGYHFDGDELMGRIKELAGSLPVFDVVRGKFA